MLDNEIRLKAKNLADEYTDLANESQSDIVRTSHLDSAARLKAISQGISVNPEMRDKTLYRNVPRHTVKIKGTLPTNKQFSYRTIDEQRLFALFHGDIFANGFGKKVADASKWLYNKGIATPAKWIYNKGIVPAARAVGNEFMRQAGPTPFGDFKRDVKNIGSGLNSKIIQPVRNEWNRQSATAGSDFKRDLGNIGSGINSKIIQPIVNSYKRDAATNRADIDGFNKYRSQVSDLPLDQQYDAYLQSQGVMKGTDQYNDMTSNFKKFTQDANGNLVYNNPTTTTPTATTTPEQLTKAQEDYRRGLDSFMKTDQALGMTNKTAKQFYDQFVNVSADYKNQLNHADPNYITNMRNKMLLDQANDIYDTKSKFDTQSNVVKNGGYVPDSAHLNPDGTVDVSKVDPANVTNANNYNANLVAAQANAQALHKKGYDDGNTRKFREMRIANQLRDRLTDLNRKLAAETDPAKQAQLQSSIASTQAKIQDFDNNGQFTSKWDERNPTNKPNSATLVTNGNSYNIITGEKSTTYNRGDVISTPEYERAKQDYEDQKAKAQRRFGNRFDEDRFNQGAGKQAYDTMKGLETKYTKSTVTDDNLNRRVVNSPASPYRQVTQPVVNNNSQTNTTTDPRDDYYKRAQEQANRNA